MPRQPHARARAWVEIDLDALLRNAQAMLDRARVPLLPMVKADAYGLGVIPVVKALETLNPWGFGVASVAEGRELRDAGIEKPIVVFTPLALDDLEPARSARLRPTLGDREGIASWARGGTDPWHLSIDTGMSRAGVRWDRVHDLRDVMSANPPEGAFTHFHSAELDDGTMQLQEGRYREAIGALDRRPKLLHTSNSAAIARSEASSYDLVRPGVFLYGGLAGDTALVTPEPVAHLRAPIVDVREVMQGETVSYGGTWKSPGKSRIATAAVGYADGYRRNFGNRATAIVKGRRVPVTGTVTMDMTMLDVSGVDCDVGDVVTLLGRDGDDCIGADELAQHAGIISYELLVGLRLRAERVYVGGGAA